MIAYDESFDLLFEILFRPPRISGRPDPEEVAILRSAVDIHGMFHIMLDDEPTLAAVERATNIYPSSWVSKRFRQFFTDEAYSIEVIIRFTVMLFYDFSDYEEYCKRFQGDGLHIVLTTLAWSHLKRTAKPNLSVQFISTLSRYVSPALRLSLPD